MMVVVMVMPTMMVHHRTWASMVATMMAATRRGREYTQRRDERHCHNYCFLVHFSVPFFVLPAPHCADNRLGGWGRHF